MRYNINSITDKNERILLKSFFSTVPEGKREYREHHHSECELSTIISGSGTYTVKEKTYSFSAGDVFLFSGDEIHCITDISDNFLLLNIHFAPRLLWTDSDAFSALRILFARNDKFENMIDRNNTHTKLIHHEIIDLNKELADKKDGYELIAKYKLFSILIFLVRYYDYIDKNIEYSKFTNNISAMTNALNFIDSNITSDITLNEIAARAMMTPTYFSSVFKKMNGISPWEYITIKRVEKAVELLKTTELTKLDIAMRCGFTSSSNFYKAFTKITGKTPGDYCKK